MSFLLRRNRPRAYAGWWDDFNRPNESPAQKPWAVWGAIPMSASISGNRMVFGAANAIANFGGWCYEHTCFTDDWGITFGMIAPKSGTVAEIFRLILNKESWAKSNPTLSNILALDIQYRTAAVGSRIMLNTYDGFGSAGNTQGEAGIPQSFFDGNIHYWMIKFDADQNVRVYLDGNLILLAPAPSGYRPGPGRRSVNYMSQMTTSVSIENFLLFDQYPVDWPFRLISWNSFFYDDYNRANGAAGNGWTQIGAGGNISGNAYAKTTTNDGGCALLRNVGASTKVRVEAVVKSTAGHQAALIAYCNAAGTQGLAVSATTNEVRIVRFSSALTNNPADWTTIGVFRGSVGIAAGQTIIFDIVDGVACVWRNAVGGELLAYAENVHSVVPNTNPWAGPYVSRRSFINSGSWDDTRISKAA